MSLDQFASHGSDASANRDGWGIVYYAEDDIRRFRDTGPAAASEWVKFVEKQELCSTLFLAHIRNANVGKVSLPNTHPFSRELGGSMHTFAHNGFLENISNNSAFALRRFMPLGDTMFVHADRRRLGTYACRIIGGPERRRDQHGQRELVGKSPAA